MPTALYDQIIIAIAIDLTVVFLTMHTYSLIQPLATDTCRYLLDVAAIFHKIPSITSIINQTPQLPRVIILPILQPIKPRKLKSTKITPAQTTTPSGMPRIKPTQLPRMPVPSAPLTQVPTNHQRRWGPR